MRSSAYGIVAVLLVLLACSQGSPASARKGAESTSDSLENQVDTSQVAWLDVTIPRYSVVARVKLLTGGVHGDILLPSARPGMSPDTLASIAQAIVAKENLTEADLYRTEAARKANLSAAYAKQHPGALESGYLGSIKDRQFTPSR
jgi:hypothetical protein